MCRAGKGCTSSHLSDLSVAAQPPHTFHDRDHKDNPMPSVRAYTTTSMQRLQVLIGHAWLGHEARNPAAPNPTIPGMQTAAWFTPALAPVKSLSHARAHCTPPTHSCESIEHLMAPTKGQPHAGLIHSCCRAPVHQPYSPCMDEQCKVEHADPLLIDGQEWQETDDYE